MRWLKRGLLSVSLFGILLTACQANSPAPVVTVAADGLLNPIGLAELPGVGILIAEEGTGEKDESAGISLLTSDGKLGRILSGLPSGRDSGDLSGVPFVAVSPDGLELYTGNFNQGHIWTIAVNDLPEPGLPLKPESLTPAMLPLNNVRLINPFDMTFDVGGIPVVSDASGNGIAIENPDGTTHFFHRFDELPDPTNERLTIDPVPTGITRVGDEYFVTLTGGCPYPLESGQLVAIDENRNQRLVAAGLNMPIDVALGADGTLWVLEFARFAPNASCFQGEGYEPNTGRLSRVAPDGSLEVVLDGLNYPGAVLPMPDGSLYISEVFPGRILRIRFGEPALISPAPNSSNPAIPSTSAPTSAVPPMYSPAPFTSLTAYMSLPTPAPAPGIGPTFKDVAPEVGLDFQHGAFRTGISMDPAAMMGAGLCWIDYDNDGWLDLYLVNSHAEAEIAYWDSRGGLPRNALYRNVSGYFVEITSPIGVDLAQRGNGCVAADFNLDGWWDLYVTADGPNALLWNMGNGTFQEGALAAGVAAEEWNSPAAVGDLNGDGWPDLFVGAYIDLENKIPKPIGAFPQDFYGLPDRVYLSTGLNDDGKTISFVEVTQEVGLVREERALGALLSDLDLDGDLDLYISNDGQPNRLYANEPWPGGWEADPEGIGFRFIDLVDLANVGDSGSGMGIAGGDYDSDGMTDLFVTNWQDEVNALYSNQTVEDGFLTFLYSTYRIGISGIGNQSTGWGTAWLDYDHDTDLDLVVVNGFVPISDPASDAQFARLFLNRSRRLDGSPGDLGQFFDWTAQAGLKEVGPLLARGSAVADYDNDGDLDLAVATIGGRAVLLENGGSPGNWLEVDLGVFAPGARVLITLPDGRELVREIYAGSSYLASEDFRLHFGLGRHEVVTRLVVYWPNGERTQLEGISSNQILSIP